MKSHLEAEHAAEHRKMLRKTSSGSGQLKASAFFQPTFKQFGGQSGMPLKKAQLELQYKEKKAELLSQLKDQDVAFTTDLWTSHGKQAYMTVTYHYINDDWMMGRIFKFVKVIVDSTCHGTSVSHEWTLGDILLPNIKVDTFLCCGHKVHSA